ncbi:11641_t:CDS:2, partial [Gigaspora margarita]
NSGRGNYKQFQYQKDVCHINKEKRPSYEVGTTGYKRKPEVLRLNKTIEYLGKKKNKQEETGKNNKETSQVDYSLIDMLSDMRERFKIIEQLIAQRS